MTATPSIDLSSWLEERLAQASPDLLRQMVHSFAEALMGAEADAVCGAGYRERTEERVCSRNGYLARDFDTWVGTLPVRIPKLRQGSYFPDWLLHRRRRAEAARAAREVRVYTPEQADAAIGCLDPWWREAALLLQETGCGWGELQGLCVGNTWNDVVVIHQTIVEVSAALAGTGAPFAVKE